MMHITHQHERQDVFVFGELELLPGTAPESSTASLSYLLMLLPLRSMQSSVPPQVQVGASYRSLLG